MTEEGRKIFAMAAIFSGMGIGYLFLICFASAASPVIPGLLLGAIAAAVFAPATYRAVRRVAPYPKDKLYEWKSLPLHVTLGPIFAYMCLRVINMVKDFSLKVQGWSGSSFESQMTSGLFIGVIILAQLWAIVLWDRERVRLAKDGTADERATD